MASSEEMLREMQQRNLQQQVEIERLRMARILINNCLAELGYGPGVDLWWAVREVVRERDKYLGWIEGFIAVADSATNPGHFEESMSWMAEEARALLGKETDDA